MRKTAGFIIKAAILFVLGSWFIVSGVSLLFSLSLKIIPLVIVGYVLYKIIQSLRGKNQRATTPPYYAQDYYYANRHAGPEPFPIDDSYGAVQDDFSQGIPSGYQYEKQSDGQYDFEEDYYHGYDVDHNDLEDYFSSEFPGRN